MNFKDTFRLKESGLVFKSLNYTVTDFTPEQLGNMLYSKCASREIVPYIAETLEDYATVEEKAEVVADFMRKLIPMWNKVKPTFELEYDPLAIQSKETVTDKQNHSSKDSRVSTKNDNVYGFDTEEAVPSETSSDTNTNEGSQVKDRTYTMDTRFEREDAPSKIIMEDRQFKCQQFADFVVDSICRELVLSVY